LFSVFKGQRKAIRIIMSMANINKRKESDKEEKVEENEKLIFTEDEVRDVEHCLSLENVVPLLLILNYKYQLQLLLLAVTTVYFTKRISNLIT
jgi:hypothetical protein